MLVIRRRVGESFLIGEEIEIEILESGPSQVKIGIRAPREVIILRKEVRLTGEENRKAASLSRENLSDLLSSFSRLKPPSVSSPTQTER